MDLERLAKMEAQVESIKEDVKDMKNDIKEVHSRITTSNREIVDKIDGMQTRIEDKMNTNAQISQEQHAEIRKDVVEDLAKMEKRVGALEQWKWYVIGCAAAFGYMIAHISDLAKIFK